MNKNAIKQRVVELIDEYVVTDDKYPIYFNDENATFSSGGCCGGDEVKMAEVDGIVEKSIEGIDGPVYLYRGRDDGIISIENEYLVKNHPDDGNKELQEIYEFEIDGLFVGWD
jgi:pimeloyl-ACP methyl ester carboxylesterase